MCDWYKFEFQFRIAFAKLASEHPILTTILLFTGVPIFILAGTVGITSILALPLLLLC